MPAHCEADGDQYPVCSLKRSTFPEATGPTAIMTGKAIIDNEKFADFSRWYKNTINLPHPLLIDDPILREPGIMIYIIRPFHN